MLAFYTHFLIYSSEEFLEVDIIHRLEVRTIRLKKGKLCDKVKELICYRAKSGTKTLNLSHPLATIFFQQRDFLSQPFEVM